MRAIHVQAGPGLEHDLPQGELEGRAVRRVQQGGRVEAVEELRDLALAKGREHTVGRER